MPVPKNPATDSPSPTRREVIAGVSAGIGTLAVSSADAAVPSPDGISRAAESIHQEVMLKAEPRRVYAVLTDPAQFQKLVLLSGAMASGMIKPTPTAQISSEAGGAFAIFGGHVYGRMIELVPHERVVQAWRPADWPAGVFSIVRFELVAAGQGTRLVFDHTGFPQGQADHLAAGWKANYWEPLAKVIA